MSWQKCRLKWKLEGAEDIWWRPSKILYEHLRLCTCAANRVLDMTTDIGGLKYYFWQESTGARLGSWVMVNLYSIIVLGRYRI